MNKLIKAIRYSFAEISPKMHRQNITLHEFHPNIECDAYISPSAIIAGEVHLYSQSMVLNNSVIKGDLNQCYIGCRANIFENCSISAIHKHPDSHEVMSVTIGNDLIIMPNCTLISCKVEDFTFIGSGSVICEGAEIEEYAYIGPNSVVPPNRIIPSGQVWAGNPARYVRHVTKGDKAAHIEFRQQLIKLINELNQEMSPENTAHLAKLQKEIELRLKGSK